ncbi:coiled-coil domain-containing protein 63-like [Nymphalis io]|uniref:coiled-coil domain-containing protein 63-like n=1 Tax=Inachis io TaxID=171585 RepID=UPI0021680C44|nr:coiled-coil domain-containing protein 63-like [Nymphalis io]
MESLNPEQQSNDLDVAKKMEDERLRLQRQVRMIQTDRLHRTMGVHPKFRRQDNLLRTLKKEFLNLYKDLKIARSGAHKKNDRKMKIDLERALFLRTQTKQECIEGLTLMDQIDGLLHRKNKQMTKLKGVVNSNNGQIEERRYLSENRLTSAENKLEAAMWRFNVVQCENKKIRDEIEHMLKDRAIFNQSWTKMLNSLNKGKKFLTDLFESSTLAYDQRDEWCTKLKSVQDKGKIDQMVQIQEMRDLQKVFDHEMKLYNFLAKKGVIRINKKVQDREEAQKKKHEEDIRKEIEYHRKILNDIHDYTEESNADKIIETFQRVDKENFSIYKLLNDFCAENEVLRRNLRLIQQNIVDRKDWNEMMEEKRQKKLKELKQKLEEQKHITEDKRIQLKLKVELIYDIMEKVNEIFKTLDCSMEPYKNLLGEKTPSLHHLGLTFRLITDKIKEMVQITYYYERFVQKKGDKTSSRLKKYTVHPQPLDYWTAPSIGLLVPADPCPSCVEARWLSRVSDTPEVPFDKQQVISAIRDLSQDPAFERSDRIHPLNECRVPRSRIILARRYMQY